jgi:hypothetical protein
MIRIATFIWILFGNTSLFSQNAKAWKSLFDGKSFKGWTIVADSGAIPANAVIADSSFLIHMSKNTSRHAFIRTNKKYKDFILELDCKRDTLFDSGILFRGITAPDTARVSLHGYMVKIDPSLTRRWTGGVFLDFGVPIVWLHPLDGDPRAQYAERVGEWNHYRIEAIGDHIKVWINGIPTTNMINTRYTEGYIALKIHYLNGTPWNENMSASFKNIRIISSKPGAYSLAMDIPVKETK